ncbi:hypothetical protein BDR05DRAFT_976858 [Suillus weaverae]|nr:hypothetical protein BDR05DRAFT_976858 [Suillus weaverae]
MSENIQSSHREGYFTCEDILQQASKAMDILEKHYMDKDHVMVFDNAITHLKCTDDALDKWDGTNWGEGRKPTNWGVEVNVVSEDGKPVHGLDGAVLKKKVPMGNGKFADGSLQSLYYPEGHKCAGVFKGMVTSKIWAECPGFQMLYNEPDFVGVKSLLEIACKACGFRAIFFPKFHCELNFIEQCWGYSKHVYREFPVSSKEADLEQNVLQALDSVPLVAIRRFSTRSLRFMDAYRKGLNGKQAAWASKKYHGHRVLPETLMRDLTEAGLVEQVQF